LLNRSKFKNIKKFKDKRIKILNLKIFKFISCKKFSFKKNKGKYITFLDTDDWWKNNKLFEQVNFLEKNNNLKMIYSNFYTLKNKKKIFIQYKKSSRGKYYTKSFK
jgi:hypothetical protein